MRRLFFSLLVIFWLGSVKANTFIVTSNADSGSGTLREAITLANANGTAVTDYIHFNLAEKVFNLRIINISSQLPDLSSNIVIDGTTQPGAFYGSTDAKICVKMDLYAASFSVISIKNAQYVEVYGLLLYYGYWQGSFSPPYRSNDLYGISVSNSQHIFIGAPARGNVINGVIHAIYSNQDSCSDIQIKSNYLGNGAFYSNPANDIDPTVLNINCGITMASVKDITIGGATSAEGNVFGSFQRGINIDSRKTAGNGQILIRHNLFGRKYDKTTLIQVYDFWDTYINIGRSRNNPVNYSAETISDYKLIVLDNNISSHMGISSTSDSIIIKRNSFEEDMRSSSNTTKLGIGGTTGIGILGGEDPADANIFKKKKDDDSYWAVQLYNTGPFTMLKNIYECNTVYGTTAYVYQFNNRIPWVQVDSTNPAFVRGRATAGSRVDLYYDDYCSGCEGNIFVTSAVADAQGNWSYTGIINKTIVATATSPVGYTSSFSMPVILYENAKVQQPTCGRNNGSITNMKSEGAESYFWLKFPSRDTASHSIDLLNASPGYYSLYGVHGGTCVAPCQRSYQLDNLTPAINQSGTQVKQPSCGLFNGSITGIYVSYDSYVIYKWINASGNTISSNLNLTGLSAGTFRFVVTDTTLNGGCSDTATFVLVNQSGPLLNSAGMNIKSATCGKSNGTITGLTASNVSGSASYRWLDSLNNLVSISSDLLNVPAGKYLLKFKDGSGCDTIVTPYYIVPDNGTISIDTIGKLVTASSCIASTGSIQQLTVNGAELYTWTNTATSAIVGNTINVFQLQPGNYQLKVSNRFGCSKTSPLVVVPASSFSQINVTAFTSGNAVCNQLNAFIHIQAFTKPIAGYGFKWIDSLTGQVQGAGQQLDNLAAGTYQLLATDNNGCEKNIFSAAVSKLPMPVIDDSQVRVTDDHCSLMMAGILALKANNLAGPTVYTWYNQANVVAGNNINLQQVSAGTYILKITDAGFCNIQSRPFTIYSTDMELVAPLYNDVVVPRYTAAVLNIKNASQGNFMLLSAAQSSTFLQQNKSGDFTINNILSDTAFYIRQVNGSCESRPVKVNVKVVDKSFFAIPTAFSPNNDGLNDRLSAKVIGYINLNYFKIYNKWGELVFETNQLNTGWDGKYKGIALNTGSFIWMAAGRDINGNIVKDRGSFTLIR